MTGRLDGKVAIVTGAARGQGAAHARVFVREGAKVLLTDVLDDEGHSTASALGVNARYLRHDVRSEADWAAAVDAAENTFGPVNILVNNAAIHWVRALEDETAAEFRKLLDVNLIGPFLGIQAVVPSMRHAGGGSIVNISSTAGLRGFHWHGAYASSKWGVRGLTKVAAIELAGDKIRVNSVHPGVIDTAMVPGPREGDRIAKLLAAQLVDRIGDPDDVANLVLFLASDESAYISGGEHIVDGGAMYGSRVGPPRPPKDLGRTGGNTPGLDI